MVVIGGGVVGTSILYHLAKLGWSDVALLERKVLTAGSTWHAAGGFHPLNSDPTMSALQAYTINLYRTIEDMSGQSCGLHFTGGCNFACNEERWLYLQNECAKHRTMGIQSKLLTPEECKKVCPVMDTKNVIGGLWDPNIGHLDCSGVTWAFAKSAQKLGAQVHQHTKVNATVQLADGSWRVETGRGSVIAEHIVNAGGLWAREVGLMAGVHLPLLPMSHHYIITEPVEAFKNAEEIAHMVDLDGETYMRQERNGILLGMYEKDCQPWASDSTPWEYGENDLLPPDLDRIAPELSQAYSRYPVLNDVGIKTIINGPFTFAPDGNPLVGPVAGTGLAPSSIRNYWVACAVMAGFMQGGGVGLSLSEWIIKGQPESYPDIFAMDVARFGKWATKAYTFQKSQENYRRRFQITYPNEDLPVARNIRSTPITEVFRAKSAKLGVGFGLEYPKYFPIGEHDKSEKYTFRRSNAFEAVKQECLATRESVGMFETGTYSKYEITGPAARDWLDKLLACKIPPVGRVCLAPMLGLNGKLMGDLTVACLAEDRYLIIGSGFLQSFHMRWFIQNGAVTTSGLHVENITDTHLGFAISGPNSRKLLQKLTTTDLSNEAFKFLSVGVMDIGLSSAVVARISVTGELGYEVMVPADQQVALYRALEEAGKEFGLRDIGGYALTSLRMEKLIGAWGREFTPEFTALQSGLSRFASLDKPTDYNGKEHALKERTLGARRKLVGLVIEDETDSDAWGDEPIWQSGKLVGNTTSGMFGHTVGRSIALGYVEGHLAVDGTPVSVSLLGQERWASVVVTPLVDPTGSRMRV